VVDVTFSPDGRFLATSSGLNDSDRTARVWEVAGGREVVRLPHEATVNQAVFSADSRYLATRAGNNTASVWDLSTGAEVARVRHDGLITDIAFSADGARLITASQDRSAQVWRWRPHDLIELACARLTRNLTEEEWRRYLGDEPQRKTCPELP
jgi:WD40 repeat protein